MGDRIFNLSLGISALIHGALFLTLLITKANTPPQPRRDIKIVYQGEIKEVQAQQKPVMPKSIQEEKWTPNSKLLTKKMDGKIPVGELGKQPAKMNLQKEKPATINKLAEKREVSIPVLKSEKITNPKYLDYNDRLRNKIQARAYSYIDNPEFQSGEVYLTFVLQANGELKQVKIIDSKTSANDYSRNVGLRSIKESAPFPPFPKDLSYPELTFNVVISFEIKK